MTGKLYNDTNIIIIIIIIITIGNKVITIGALFYPTTRNTRQSDGFA
jgi:hypothetical protein